MEALITEMIIIRPCSTTIVCTTCLSTVVPVLYLSYTQNDIPYGDALTTSLTGIFNHYYVELKLLVVTVSS